MRWYEMLAIVAEVTGGFALAGVALLWWLRERDSL